MVYKDRIKNVLSLKERTIFSRLSSPQKIQDFLDSVPINFEHNGETNHSPRNLLKNRVAHCFEGAVFAAAVLAYHGQRPLLMDLATAYDDEDHTVALFKEGRYWGAISKTNHAILRYRDPIYSSPRELAMSYVHEYVMTDGKKSMRAFSAPFDLTRFSPEKWITTDNALDWLMDTLSRTRYHSAVPKKQTRKLRKASSIELKALEITEWQDPRD